MRWWSCANGRIAAVGPRASTPIPPGMRVIDVTGATIAPGLWDMHAHAAQIEWLPAYLAAGVTTFRDMGGEQPFLTAMRDAVACGKGLGPRVLLAGLVDGDAPGAFGAVVAATPEQGRAVVDRYKAAGFEQMKLYSLLQPDVVAAITARAHELGMTRDRPRADGAWPDAERSKPAWITSRTCRSTAIRNRRKRARRSSCWRSSKIVIDPTLPWNELLGHAPETRARKLRAWLRACAAGAARELPQRARTTPTPRPRSGACASRQTMVKALFDAGVPIVAGTDGALPGYSLLRSIEMYVEAGMTPMQAIESATRVPAESMGLARRPGTIEAGKRADLIVLERRSAGADFEHPQAAVGRSRTGECSNLRSCGRRQDSNDADPTIVSRRATRLFARRRAASPRRCRPSGRSSS